MFFLSPHVSPAEFKQERGKNDKKRAITFLPHTFRASSASSHALANLPLRMKAQRSLSLANLADSPAFASASAAVQMGRGAAAAAAAANVTAAACE